MPRIPHKIIDGVEHKKCCKCNNWKMLTNFHKCKKKSDTLDNRCKACRKLISKMRYKKKRKHILETCKTYNQKNREKLSAYQSKWQKLNREKNIKRITKWQRKERKKNPAYKMKCTLRGRLAAALKGCQKDARTMELLGCSVLQLQCHFGRHFDEYMTLTNHGKIRQRVFYRYGNLPDFVQSLNSTNDRYPDGLTYKGVHEFENEKKVKMKIVIIFQIKYLEGNPMAYIVTESDGEKKKYVWLSKQKNFQPIDGVEILDKDGFTTVYNRLLKEKFGTVENVRDGYDPNTPQLIGITESKIKIQPAKKAALVSMNKMYVKRKFPDNFNFEDAKKWRNEYRNTKFPVK